MERNDRIEMNFLDLGLPIKLGRVAYTRAHKPLGIHTHPGSMEFVYVARGRQHYAVNGEEYAVNAGELFFTLPDEPHGTAGKPEEKSLFYFLIVDAGTLADGFIGCGEEGRELLGALYAMRRRVFKCRADVRRTLDGMLACHREGTPFRRTALRNLLSNFLLGAVESEARRAPEPRGEPMRRVLEHIERNIAESIPLKALAELAGLSLPRFKSSFRKLLGVPPREYILRKKVDSAKALLLEGRLSVTDIALQLQFSSSQYFATVFKRFAFATPTEFRLAGTAGRRHTQAASAHRIRKGSDV